MVYLPGVSNRNGESFESLARRFKKQCDKAGVLAECRQRSAYEKPSVKKKRKSIAARKRAIKLARRS